ncbi:hypothetical protein QMA71_19875 [Pseudomonas otitidis]|uniref:hypothetical protein n=1 Tax=Metapseudomonas otitidis TaxID=319939 RepID=UPI0024AE0688|nr:hypothetical protein [Pseudomonas otitidis]MDI6527803.1 hypothetical protein [Pseudomonas otitidis]
MGFFKKEQPITSRATPRIKNTSTELESYLDYYNQLQEPGYAVLITGAWGTGKSHQTKEAIGADAYYVSLFGLQTAEDIYSAVFAQMFPTKAKLKSAGKSIQDVSGEFAGFGLGVGSLASGVINAFIRESVDNSKPIIFDDLERCSLPIKDCLGVINKYVEHHGCRVIVIAHDEKLKSDFLDAKEKIFGHVITATPQYEAAFDKFIEKYETESTHSHFLKNKRTIIQIMKDSKCESLRILKHTLEDLSRIYDTLTAEHKSNQRALSEITQLFTALSLETRNGALKKEDLLSRHIAYTGYYLRKSAQGDKAEKPAIMAVSERHPNINTNNQLLNDDVLASMLFNGVFNEELIRQSLNNSLSYSKAEELAPWRAFMNMDEMSDSDTEKAAQRLILQFENREIEEPGEILHLFAFRLLMSEIGFINSSLNETTEECKKYLEDLHAANRMPMISRSPYSRFYFSDAHAGYMYWVKDSYKANFSTLFESLIEYGGYAIKAKYPSIAQEMLTLMENNSAGFVEKLSGRVEGEDWYAHMDILTSIQPKDFTSSFMKVNPKDSHNIAKALKNRYSSGELERHLRNEADWLLDVISLLEHERDSSPPLRKMRLERLIPWQLKTMAQETIAAM